MAPTHLSLLYSSYTLLVFATVVLAATAIRTHPSREITTRLHFYFHETWQGAGTTDVFVDGLEKGPFTFGSISVFDDELRTGPEASSRLIGRAQGTSIFASMEDHAALAVMNMVFTDGEFNGSTIALLGRVESSGDVERTIVGGTGRFRMARGYAISKIISTTPAKFVVHFDVYVMHY